MKVETKWHTFAAAHRLAWHPKCQRLHGHNFRVRCTVEGEVDKEKGIVLDFGVVNKAVEEAVAPLDHRFLAPESAHRVEMRQDVMVDGWYYDIEGKYMLPEKDVVVLPMQHVSTENLAVWILGELEKQEWAAGKKLTVHVDESGDNGVEVTSSKKELVWNTLSWGSTNSGTMGYEFPPQNVVWVPSAVTVNE